MTEVQITVFLYSNRFWTRTTEPAYLRSGVDADLYVDPNGSNDNSGLTPDKPLQTITAALARIFANSYHPHTIYLGGGTYSPSINEESYPLNWKSYVSLYGAAEETTILDAEGVGGVLYCSNDVNFVIENLTIQNGSTDYGGGIYCESSSPTLTNVTITGNSASIRGGGIWVKNSNLCLSKVTITGNSASDYGGGIYFSWNSSVTFDSVNRCNIFLNNTGFVGYDLYSGSIINVVVDTFTVMHPTDYYAYPSENFTFDILNFVVEQAEADLYVDPLGNNDNSGLSQDEPLQTITCALSLIYADSLNPHTIYLAEGTYSPSTTGENYPLYCISYVSLSGAAEETTILDAEGLDRVLYCSNVNNFGIENLTIRNGVTYYDGGGIFCRKSSPTLTNVTITGNSASSGGGIYCWNNSSPSLENITLSGNTAYSGGGIYFGYNSSATFDSVNRCNIFLNNAYDVGKDLYAGWDTLTINVVVDTFTVLYPTDNYAYPVTNFTFDILNFKIEQAVADLYVDPNGNDDNSGLSPDVSLQTITYALKLIYADSLRPHTIYLAEGTYSPSITGETYPLNLKSYVSLSGASEQSTILDAEGESRVIDCSNVNNCDIENLTIRNGVASSGGGIYCWNNSNPSLENVTVSENTATGSGGGIYCFESDPALTNLTVIGNSATQGGGIYCRYSNPTLIDVIFSQDSAEYGGAICCIENSNLELVSSEIFSNSAGSRGGGIYCESSCPNLDSVIIGENSAIYGGGIYCMKSSPTLTNVVINEDSAKYGGGIYITESNAVLNNVTITGNFASSRGGGIAVWFNSNPILINTIFWNDSPQEIYCRSSSSIDVAYSDVEGGHDGIYGSDYVNWLDGNIDADPMFVGGDPFDYCLTENSPCVDAGIAFFVWNGDTIVNLPDTAYKGNAPDMGAYESPYTAAIYTEDVFPEHFALYPNYPNPFNPITNLKYDLPKQSIVKLIVYDILGRKVRTLVNETQPPGYKLVKWDGKDDTGKSVGSGMYICLFKACDFIQTRKILLLK